MFLQVNQYSQKLASDASCVQDKLFSHERIQHLIQLKAFGAVPVCNKGGYTFKGTVPSD